MPRKDNWDKVGIIFGGLTAIGTIWLAFFKIPEIAINIQQLSSQVENVTEKIRNITWTPIKAPSYIGSSISINSKYLTFEELITEKCFNLEKGETITLPGDDINEVCYGTYNFERFEYNISLILRKDNYDFCYYGWSSECKPI